MTWLSAASEGWCELLLFLFAQLVGPGYRLRSRDDPGDVGVVGTLLAWARLAFLGVLGAALRLVSLPLLLLRLPESLVDRWSCVGHGAILYSPGAVVNPLGPTECSEPERPLPAGAARTRRRRRRRGPARRASRNRPSCRSVADRRHRHRHQRFGYTVGGEHDAHHPAHERQAEEFGGHQRDDHVVAAEADAEQNGRRRQRYPRWARQTAAGSRSRRSRTRAASRASSASGPRASPSTGGRRGCRRGPARATCRDLRLREPRSRLRYSFRFCIVPPTAPIEAMLPSARR